MTESPEGRLPEKVARSFAEQMLSALQCARNPRDPSVFWSTRWVRWVAVEKSRETVSFPIGGLKVGFFGEVMISMVCFFYKSIIQQEVNLKVNWVIYVCLDECVDVESEASYKDLRMILSRYACNVFPGRCWLERWCMSRDASIDSHRIHVWYIYIYSPTFGLNLW